MPRAWTLSKLDKERGSDVFHGDPPEQPIVSPKHNGVARIVLGVIQLRQLSFSSVTALQERHTWWG